MIIIVMITVYGNQINANLKKAYVYNLKEDIRRLSEEEVLLLEAVNKEINESEELYKEFLEYEKDNDYEITYTKKSESNTKLSIEYRYSKLFICDDSQRSRFKGTEIEVNSKENKIFLKPKLYKIELFIGN